ncbi:MAG: RNA methyltransferase [Bacteroidetes bacterium]|nr:RNA methyltransferase [Bacteroidota bacterium]
MKIPEAFFHSLQGIPGFDRLAFEAIHQSGEQVTSVRFNPFRKKLHNSQWIPADLQDKRKALPEINPIPWCKEGVYLSDRPVFTLDPMFHAGCYYVQEASSMFIEQAVKTCFPDHSVTPYRVLDLCAAPGGKSTHLSALFPQGLVVANEVIKTRSGILAENTVKWGHDNIVVTNNDASDFKKLPGYFDLILVDAPCSGSGMFRKDPDAVAEWSLQHVEHCSRRQRRILEDAWGSLKENGILIYCTCSYSKEEDEDIADWLAGKYDVESIALQPATEWGIIETFSEQKKCRGYRFYPDKLKGEGFYISCLRKKNTETVHTVKPKKFSYVSVSEAKIIFRYTQQSSWQYLAIHTQDDITLINPRWQEDLSVLFTALYIKKMGIRVGRLIRDELIPSQELAQCCILSQEINTLELPLESALQYLRKADFSFQKQPKGWLLVIYSGFPLGWAKSLSHRMNNYYPQGLRILKH